MTVCFDIDIGLSRELISLKKEGIIDYDRYKITLL